MHRGIRLAIPSLLAAGALLVTPGARAQEVRFVPSTAAHEHAVQTYRGIWSEYGKRIVEALEARTCLPFSEANVPAIVADTVSDSGGPDHPMSLRATYALEVKQATLVHELGHRHLWQLAERLDDVDGHRTLYLILDLVWQDVWGDTFVERRIRGESEWRASYDYAAAWNWARSQSRAERARLWQELLALNGISAECEAFRERDG